MKKKKKNGATCAFQFFNVGFVYNSVNKLLTFDYYYDSNTNSDYNNITAYYYGDGNLSGINSATNYKIKYSMLSKTSNVIAVASGVQNAYCIMYTSDKSYTYPVASKSDGNTTWIDVGDNVPLLIATRDNISYNNSVLMAQPSNYYMGSVQRTYTQNSAHADLFTFPLIDSSSGYVKVTLTGYSNFPNNIYKARGSTTVQGFYINVTQAANFNSQNASNANLPDVFDVSGVNLGGCGINGDTTSSLFLNASLLIATLTPNLMSVQLSFDPAVLSANYVASYEVTFQPAA